jgi:hypothetical protein
LPPPQDSLECTEEIDDVVEIAMASAHGSNSNSSSISSSHTEGQQRVSEERKVSRVPRLIQSLERVLESDRALPLADMRVQMLRKERGCHPPQQCFASEAAREMRAQLVPFIMCVTDQFFLGRETFHLSVNFADRYLAAMHSKAYHGKPLWMQEVIVATSKDIRLLGLACVFIAAKYDEVVSPNLADFSACAGEVFSSAQLHAMEYLVLELLEWRLMTPTSYNWVLYYIKLACIRISATGNGEQVDQKQKIESLLLYKNFLKVTRMIDLAASHVFFLGYLPSFIAITALASVHPYFAGLDCSEELSGYSHTQLAPLMGLFREFDFLPEMTLSVPDDQSLASIAISKTDLYTRQIYSMALYDAVGVIKTKTEHWTMKEVFPVSKHLKDYVGKNTPMTTPNRSVGKKQPPKKPERRRVSIRITDRGQVRKRPTPPTDPHAETAFLRRIPKKSKISIL